VGFLFKTRSFDLAMLGYGMAWREEKRRGGSAPNFGEEREEVWEAPCLKSAALCSELHRC
jgi:hypothetical protein